MNYIIIFFGTLITLGGMILLVRPDFIFGLFTRYGNSIGLHIFAVIVRIVLGVALIIGASGSKFPVALQILGWLSISAALILGVVGRARFQGLIKWVLQIAPIFHRLAAVFAILLGCFLIYAVL